MKMIGWDDEFGGGQVGMAWLWESRGKLAITGVVFDK
ncbi:hypothetical protein AZ008_003910 [Klebsiella pneumoniae]|nr:hypothetical protein SM78_03713 [Klebsiella pneumoniae]OUG97335.1 hypothetical protein AZ008_003910 [Klebsiella pneumoniae]OUH01873.1 hypothetical protein AZ009_004124 [Klebsiella pneumoniae]OUH03493.1 hypothetical protein AZ010_004100 [Klebsiella pneumoniae]OUH33422.1 hypothetical protein AZ023_004108 [Klebsiella pneumoniae]